MKPITGVQLTGETQDQNIRLTKEELGEYHDKPGLVETSDGGILCQLIGLPFPTL